MMSPTRAIHESKHGDSKVPYYHGHRDHRVRAQQPVLQEEMTTCNKCFQNNTGESLGCKHKKTQYQFTTKFWKI